MSVTATIAAIKTGFLIGDAAIKLGAEGWKFYKEMNQENADAFSEEALQKIIDDHRSTEEILAEHGIEMPKGED